jgi:hypothetical protein
MKRRRASGTKPISSRTPKNCSNGGVTEIDDLGAGIVHNQPVEQLHLAQRFGDVHRPDEMRKPPGESRLARIEIVSDQRLVAGMEEFDQEPRHQRLADARPRRSDDVERMRLRHGGNCSLCRRSQLARRGVPAARGAAITTG